MIFLPSLTVAIAEEMSQTAFQYFQQGNFEQAVQTSMGRNIAFQGKMY
jgi:hypothetical protein